MKIEACIERHGDAQGPDPWDEDWGSSLPLHHIICHDLDGTPHMASEYIWPWTAYTAHRNRCLLHFYYWKQNSEKITTNLMGITPEREARMRELQFLMTRQIYFGKENAPKTLYGKLLTLRYVARFAEVRSCSVRDVLTQTTLLDACGESLSDQVIESWMTWVKFLRQLDSETQLGFILATPKRWKYLERRKKKYHDQMRQCAPLPTRIYAALINNLSAELDDIEAHKPLLLSAFREAFILHQQARENKKTANGIYIDSSLIEKHGLTTFVERRGYSAQKPLRCLAAVLGEIYKVCKLQVHVFSGMRRDELRHLPYHCMAFEKGLHGRNHCLIAGITTKLNKGRRHRTKWVTTEHDGFRAIRLAQDFAAMIYHTLGVTPSEADDRKDAYPLFPSGDYLPWNQRQNLPSERVTPAKLDIDRTDNPLLSRLCPIIDEVDIAELDEIDPFRAWREEPEFTVGQRWLLTSHQLRRSLAIYANASGLVRHSSLRRQLQHITREMSMYYGRGSTFCKNFVAEDAAEFRKHVAVDWQNGAEEAEMLAFVRDVLNSTEPMFGGAGTFYERQRERGEVMSREEVAKQMKAGLLAYREGPLGGCTRPGVCEIRKGLNLIDTICATDGCKHLVGKYSKIVQVIRLKRAAMVHISPGSITQAMENEDLEALERVEREWRPPLESAGLVSTGGKHA